MKKFFCDFHIHIGATSKGNPVKITASRNLVFEAIVKESLRRKGMDMIAVVDCASPGVIFDIKEMMKKGDLFPWNDGGLIHREKLVVLPASEVETTEENGGSSHHICYFPDIKTISEFSRIMSRYITNIELSSQKAKLSAVELLNVVKDTGGVLVPAHIFTPHKSLYGNAGRRYREIFQPEEDQIFAMELGLSADTDMADYIQELENITFLSNSDAHSIPKIAREYNILEMEKANFREFVLALHRRGGRGVLENIGMDPRLGRYHRTFCLKCHDVETTPPPVLKCSRCGGEGKNIVPGVFDRILSIADFSSPIHPYHRPPYKYQIPLEFVPGINDKVIEYLISLFGSEMAVLNRVSDKDLLSSLKPQLARNIISAREGKLKLHSGGGGHYGKVQKITKIYDQLSMDI